MNDLQIFMDVLLCKLLDALIMALSCNGSSWRFWSNFVFWLFVLFYSRIFTQPKLVNLAIIQEICSSIFTKKLCLNFITFFEMWIERRTIKCINCILKKLVWLINFESSVHLGQIDHVLAIKNFLYLLKLHCAKFVAME